MASSKHIFLAVFLPFLAAASSLSDSHSNSSGPVEIPFWSAENARSTTVTTCARSVLNVLPHTQACAAPHWYAWVGQYDTSAWSQRPMCIDANEDGAAEPHPHQHQQQQSQDQTYCTFVAAHFAEGKGLVMVTTPEVAEHIATRGAFKHPESIAGLNDLVTGRFSPPAYEQRIMPIKGVGVVANRTIYRGERIMQESVPWIFHRSIYIDLSDEDRLALQWNAVYMMNKQGREEFLALKGHHGGDFVHDLMRTNSFGAYYGPESDPDQFHNNLLPRISRFNHDCRPNAHYTFDKETMTHYVSAISNINNGEEITISYTDSEAPYDERADAIHSSWGFACQCSLCRQPAALQSLSDTRVALIKATKRTLNDWHMALPLADRIRKAELLVDLYVQERLWAGATSGYEALAYAHAVAGNRDQTMRAAARAVEGQRVVYGDVFARVDEVGSDMESLMVAPEKHRVWLWRPAEPEKTQKSDQSNEKKGK